ncbi:MAG TPA: DEAD/DEAH box helicase [Oligoflexia bacterium]|nr:DEAD/DEAH box helicase [Oligoflexia bacterium]HMP27207.1 DEAD/DEAH box helicase [Oligoflexia bacterium]
MNDSLEFLKENNFFSENREPANQTGENRVRPYEIANLLAELIVKPAGGEQAAKQCTPLSFIFELSDKKIILGIANPSGKLNSELILRPHFTDLVTPIENLICKIVAEQGEWLPDREMWLINEESLINLLLTLISTQAKVLNTSAEQLTFSEKPADLKIKVEWMPQGALFEMNWILDGQSNNTEKELVGQVFGSSPLWLKAGRTIWRLSETASKIYKIFRFERSFYLNRIDLGSVIEQIESLSKENSNFFQVVNPSQQPKTEKASPTPEFEIEIEDSDDIYRTENDLSARGFLRFNYPTPKEKNSIILPNQAEEKKFVEKLIALGCSQIGGHQNEYYIGGEALLEMLHNYEKQFPPPWKLKGFEDVKKKVRVVDLGLSISINAEKSQSKKTATSQKIDWFECDVKLLRGGATVPISSLFKNSRSGQNEPKAWIRLDNGSYARVPGGNLEQLKRILGMVDVNFRASNTIKSRINSIQALSLSRSDLSSVTLNIDLHLKELNRKLATFGGIEKTEPPKYFHGELRPYQHDGLNWLCFLNQFELGGILADEMGLGKTIQALALLQKLKEERSAKAKFKPNLVIAPTSVVMNWLYEAKKFTPKLNALLLHGPTRKKLFSTIPQYDLIITSYALLRNDKSELERFEFEYCILDEAQNIKNFNTSTAKCAKSIRATHRLALTGTPTENRPLELWSIMDFLLPGFLGSAEFFKNFIEKPILEGNNPEQIMLSLNNKTKPFILRRKKAEVEKELPEKIETTIHVEMTPSQAQLYGDILEEVRPKIFSEVKKKGVVGASISILAALLRLRQVCNHPNSIRGLETVSGFDSGKFNAFKELLESALDEGRKVLVFSQFLEMLNIMKRHLDESGRKYLYFDGSTKERQPIIDAFNNREEERLLLLSLKAGGFGLNLTAADTVIIYDPWWNPAVENQAVDRAHRIGQTKTVSVYRLQTENSIEHKIMDLKRKKAKIADALINEGGLSSLKLTKDDLELLFSPLKGENI